jgi:YD repeat-containing protein
LFLVSRSGTTIIYSYDDNGNLTDDGTYKYYYDCENRLTGVNEVNDAPVVSYSYDYEGRRISKTVGQTTTKYCYDGDIVNLNLDAVTAIADAKTAAEGIHRILCTK